MFAFRPSRRSTSSEASTRANLPIPVAQSANMSGGGVPVAPAAVRPDVVRLVDATSAPAPIVQLVSSHWLQPGKRPAEWVNTKCVVVEHLLGARDLPRVRVTFYVYSTTPPRRVCSSPMRSETVPMGLLAATSPPRPVGSGSKRCGEWS